MRASTYFTFMGCILAFFIIFVLPFGLIVDASSLQYRVDETRKAYEAIKNDIDNGNVRCGEHIMTLLETCQTTLVDTTTGGVIGGGPIGLGASYEQMQTSQEDDLSKALATYQQAVTENTPWRKILDIGGAILYLLAIGTGSFFLIRWMRKPKRLSGRN